MSGPDWLKDGETQWFSRSSDARGVPGGNEVSGNIWLVSEPSGVEHLLKCEEFSSLCPSLHVY